MKNTWFIFFSILPLIILSQTVSKSSDNNPFDLPIDSLTGKITFVKIIPVKDKSKSEIYSNTKSWITEYYKSPKDVINIDDKESGILLLQSFFPSTFEMADHSNFTVNYYYSLKVAIKDSKYKISITNIEQQALTEFTESGYAGKKSPIEKALLIKSYSEESSNSSIYTARKETADVIKKEISRIILSIEHANSEF